jgi:hypothetical protein
MGSLHPLLTSDDERVSRPSCRHAHRCLCTHSRWWKVTGDYEAQKLRFVVWVKPVKQSKAGQAGQPITPRHSWEFVVCARVAQSIGAQSIRYPRARPSPTSASDAITERPRENRSHLLLYILKSFAASPVCIRIDWLQKWMRMTVGAGPR